MKHRNLKKFSAGVAVVTASFGFSSIALADIVTDATTKIDELKTSAETMGTPILGLVAAIALIGIIVMLVKRAR